MATITSLGTATDKSATSPWTVFSSITLSAGDTLVVCVAGDPYTPDAGDSTTWDGNDITVGAVNETGNSYTWGGIYTYYSASGGTGDVVSTIVNAPTARAVAAYKISGLESSPIDKSSTDQGYASTANSGATATLSQADEVVVGMVAAHDEIDDLDGTWTTGAGYVSGNEQGDGTNGGADATNQSVYSAAEIVSATTAQTAQVTGMDTIMWAALIVTYKVAAAAGWTNIAKVNGVTATDLAKVNGIAVADIAKIDGVAV